MNGDEDNFFEDTFFDHFFSEEYQAEQARLHQQMDEHLKKHYNYEHDEAAVQRLLSEANAADDEDDKIFGCITSLSPVRIFVRENTPGVLKLKH